MEAFWGPYVYVAGFLAGSTSVDDYSLRSALRVVCWPVYYTAKLLVWALERKDDHDPTE